MADPVADAERIEAAAAVLERRYPAARPDVLDTVISELHSIARAWRRMAASETAGEAALDQAGMTPHARAAALWRLGVRIEDLRPEVAARWRLPCEQAPGAPS